MPKSSKAKLEFQKKYNAEPLQLAKRIKNNQARAQALKAGTVHIGDNLQVDHIKPLDEGGTNADGNTRVISRKKNEAWRKTHPGMYGSKK